MKGQKREKETNGHKRGQMKPIEAEEKRNKKKKKRKTKMHARFDKRMPAE